MKRSLAIKYAYLKVMALLERSSYEVYCLDYGIFKTIYK
jgi:hypothetical protein